MPNVARVTAVWNGFQGAPGYSKFSFGNVTDLSTAGGATSAVRAMFQGVASLIRTGHTVQVQAVVEMHDMDTGLLVSEFTVTPAPSIVNGTASAATVWAGGTGVTVNWKSAGIFNGRRVRGRTYLVPLIGVADVDGTLLATAMSTVQSAADGLVTSVAADLVVWSKKFTTDAKPVQIQGGMNSVTAAVITDKTGILKSRRD